MALEQAGHNEVSAMEYLRKVIRKIRQGALRDIYLETCWIYGYARQYRKIILLYIFIGLISTAAGLVSGLVSKNLINLVVEGSSAGGRILHVAAMYVALGLGNLLLGAVNNRVSAHVNLHVNREVRDDIFERFMNTSWESISQYHTGDLLLRLDKDVSVVSSSVLGWIPSLITGLAQLFGALAVMLYFDPTMVLCALICVPVSLLIMGALAPKLRRHGLRVQESAADLNSFYTDSLQNIQSVKAFDLVAQFSARLRGLQDRYVSVSLDQNRVSVSASVIMGLAAMVTGYLCLGWGVYRLWTGRIDFGTMVLFIQLAGYLSSAASGLIKLGPSVISATVSAKRLMSVLELPTETVQEQKELETLRHTQTGITVSMEKLGFSYQTGQPVLKNVDFQAAPGQVTAVVGPSGSGKTTMLRLILCLVSPETGRGFLQGDGVELALQPGLRTLFSYVPQQKALFSGTVAETLRMVKPEATEEDLWQVLRLVELEDKVKKLPEGLMSPIGEDGGLFSQGQGQRLSIARALLRDAPILLLDEATSALDVAMERRLLRNIMEHSRNRTVIVTTHRPTVLTMCQRVYEIRDGGAVILNEAEIAQRIEEF